jgi:hypothetical protein
MMKLLLVLGSPLICIALIAFPGGLQAGTLYDCRDQSGSVILTDAPLGEGYNCRPKGFFQDATEEQKEASEKERIVAAEAEQRILEEKEKAEAEKRKKEEEAARQKQLEDSAVKYRFW